MGYPFDCAILRDLVPRLLFLTCSRPTEQVRRIGAVTCSWLIKLRLAYILCYFIRNRRYSFDLLSGFTRGEYHVIRVDFIIALRRTKGRGRRTLRSPPSPSSGLHLIHPGYPLRRGISAAAGLGQYRYLYSGAVVTPQFRMLCSYLCSGWYRSRFSRVVGLVSHVFHYWWGRSFVPAVTWCFALFFRRICADRDWSVSLDW